MDEDGYESDDVDEDGNRRVKSSNGDGGDDEEKRKNFLERNRQAALKCRQRKKAWLASLQAKVEYLQSDNENLQGTVGALRNEVMYLKSQLMQAQRQLGGHGGGAMVGVQVEQGGPTGMGRNSVSGPGPMQNMAGAMEMSHNMPPQSQQHQQSNINAMAAAAAAAAGNNRMGSTAASTKRMLSQGRHTSPASQATSNMRPMYTRTTPDRARRRRPETALLICGPSSSGDTFCFCMYDEIETMCKPFHIYDPSVVLPRDVHKLHIVEHFLHSRACRAGRL
ncbi:hypothetical protein L7F22_045450 [Adiantum nelumboides]|nr:hypothetical protein [Adiantum nelumboides]